VRWRKPRQPAIREDRSRAELGVGKVRSSDPEPGRRAIPGSERASPQQSFREAARIFAGIPADGWDLHRAWIRWVEQADRECYGKIRQKEYSLLMEGWEAPKG
jgi:hypothetical protein